MKPPEGVSLPGRVEVERFLIEAALQPLLNEVTAGRAKEIETIARHIEISLNAIIDRVQCQFADLIEAKESGSRESGLEGRIKQTEDRLDELNARLEGRRAELQREGQCTIADIQLIGRAWVLPHPERTAPGIAPMVRDDEIERIAVKAVIAYEAARGREVESVEKENRGFDLISRRGQGSGGAGEQNIGAGGQGPGAGATPPTSNPAEVRFIEVKGRAGVGEVALSANEYRTAERLKEDYWLYVVYNCATQPEVHVINDPVRLGWQPIVKVEHYHVAAKEILMQSGSPNTKRGD